MDNKSYLKNLLQRFCFCPKNKADTASKAIFIKHKLHHSKYYLVLKIQIQYPKWEACLDYPTRCSLLSSTMLLSCLPQTLCYSSHCNKHSFTFFPYYTISHLTMESMAYTSWDANTKFQDQHMVENVSLKEKTIILSS